MVRALLQALILGWQAKSETIEAQLTTAVAEKDIQIAESSTKVSEVQRGFQAQVVEIKNSAKRDKEALMQNAHDDKEAFHAQMGCLQTELAAIKRERDACIEDSRKSNAIAEESAAEAVKLRKDLTGSQAETQAVRAKMNDLKNCLDEAMREHESMSTQMRMLQEGSQHEVARIAQHYEAIQARMQAEMDKAIDAVKSSRQEADSTKSSAARLSDELELCKRELSEQQLKLVQELTEMSNSLSDSKADVQGKDSQVAILESEMSALRMQLVEGESRLVQSQAQAKQHEAAAREAEGKASQMQEEHSALKYELNHYKSQEAQQRSSSREHVFTLEAALRRNKAEVSRLSAELVSAHQQINAMQATMQQQVELMASARRQAIIEKDELRRQLENSTSGNDILLSQIRQAEDRIVDLQTELEMQALVVEAGTSRSHELERALEALRQHAAELEETIR